MGFNADFKSLTLYTRFIVAYFVLRVICAIHLEGKLSKMHLGLCQPADGLIQSFTVRGPVSNCLGIFLAGGYGCKFTHTCTK